MIGFRKESPYIGKFGEDVGKQKYIENLKRFWNEK